MTSQDATDQLAEAPQWGEALQRTVTWHDPVVTARAGAAMSGRDYLQAIMDGTLPPPPIASLFGFTIGRIADGEAWFHLTPDTSVYNPIGIVHGGTIATMLDSALGCAVHTTLPAGVGYASIEIKVSYLRPVTTASGELTAHGWVTKPGRRVAFADADVRDAAGKLVATGSSSIAVLPPGA